MHGKKDELSDSCIKNKLTRMKILKAIRKEKEEVRFEAEAKISRENAGADTLHHKAGSYREKKLAAETKLSR